VKCLFMEKGRLSGAYDEFAREQQELAQAKASRAFDLARAEAVAAMQRVIALSREASSEAGILKSNEYILSVSGIAQEVPFKSFFKNKTYDQAKTMVSECFQALYGKPLVEDCRFILRWKDPNNESEGNGPVD